MPRQPNRTVTGSGLPSAGRPAYSHGRYLAAERDFKPTCGRSICRGATRSPEPAPQSATEGARLASKVVGKPL